MPIPFEVWIENVVGNARIVGDQEILKRVWIEGDTTITSIMDFDECYMQLISDTDALGYLEVYPNDPRLSKSQQNALREYILAFRDFDDRPFLKNGDDDALEASHDYAEMFASAAWIEVIKKAQILAAVFKDLKLIVI